MRNETPELSIWRILKEDQQTIICSAFLLFSIALFLYSVLFPDEAPTLGILFPVITGSISFILLLRRILLALHLQRYGVLVIGRVIDSRDTAKGYREIEYCFQIQDDQVFGTKEVYYDLVPHSGDVCIIVSPSNHAEHLIVDMPGVSENNDREALLREYASIRDPWIQLLEQLPMAETIQATDSEPEVLLDESLPFLFKEFKLFSKPELVEIKGESSTLTIESNGYSVAIRDGLGGWKPTTLFFLDKDSPQAALEEMRTLRQHEINS